MEDRIFKRKIYDQLLNWKRESNGKSIHSSRILWRYMVYTKDFAKDQETIMIPAYMVPFV